MPRQPFLHSLGLTIDPNNDYHCSNPHAAMDINIQPTDNIIAPLTHYGLLAIDGPDTATFLQGQTTCDVTAVDKSNGCCGAYCTPKGRMVSSFYLACSSENRYLMRQRQSLLHNVQTRLGKYIVFSKAELSDASDQYFIVGLSGAAAKKAIESTFQQSPKGQNNCLNSDGNLIIQRDQQGRLFECWLDCAQLATLWPILSDNMQLRGSKSWELLMIRQGLAEISNVSTEQYIPQMLNYHLTGAVSFNKGCYTGQEIIARMHYKGKLKRNLYHIKLAADQVAAGDKIYDQNNHSIGDIINIVVIDTQHSEALAVISDGSLNNKDISTNKLLAGNDLASVEILPLAYAITNDD